jgi:hypothetical protein
VFIDFNKRRWITQIFAVNVNIHEFGMIFIAVPLDVGIIDGRALGYSDILKAQTDLFIFIADI